MKNLFIKVLIFCFAVSALTVTGFSQPKPKATPKPKPAATPAPQLTEEQVLENARKTSSAAARVEALQKFIEKYPESTQKIRAQELIVSARAQQADEKLRAQDLDGAYALFELAIKEAPSPMSEDLFDQVVMMIPENFAANGRLGDAIDISKVIEEKSAANVDQLLSLAKFQLKIDNNEDAQRLAKRVVELDSSRAEAYEVLGSSSVTSLRLADAADAYEKALQVNPNSSFIRLYLANIKRSLGRSQEALALYDQILQKDGNNTLAKTGRILSLFDTGKRREAELELQQAITANPKNFNLLSSAAYWYAAHSEGEKAIDYAQRSIAVEPRYVWAYVAMSRGMILQKRPEEAERMMLQAAQYGNFPTLHYELASNKIALGLYDEAAADLRRSFEFKDGKLEVKLAGKYLQSGDSFTEIIALERKASIYQPVAADSAENAKALKELLIFDAKVNQENATPEDIVSAVDAFTSGKDKMQFYRRMYAASKLLQKKVAPEKVLELIQAAIPGVDTAVDMPGAATAVLAEELIEPRQEAIKKGTAVTVPDIQRPILLSVLRGRVEELSATALLQQKKNDEAVVKLRRAVTVLPEKSSWWRSSLWKLGGALDTAGKSEEAFEAYSKSYAAGTPDRFKFAVLQGLCQSLYNITDSCGDKVIETANKPASTKTPSNSLLKASATPVAQPTPTVSTPVEEKAKTDTTSGTGAHGTIGLAEPAKDEMPIPVPTSTPAPTPEPTPIITVPKTEVFYKPERVAVVEKKTEDTVKTVAIPETQGEPQKEVTTETPKDTEKSAETAVTQTTTPVTTSSEKVEEKDPKIETGETRKRTVMKTDGVVYSNSNASVTVAPLPGEAAGCQLAIVNTKLRLISNGGWSALTIDMRGEGNPADIKIANENSEDLALELQPDIGRDIRRVMYVVRSISNKKGEFKVYVESPCSEKKEILVTVR